VPDGTGVSPNPIVDETAELYGIYGSVDFDLTDSTIFMVYYLKDGTKLLRSCIQNACDLVNCPVKAGDYCGIELPCDAPSNLPDTWEVGVEFQDSDSKARLPCAMAKF